MKKLLLLAAAIVCGFLGYAVTDEIGLEPLVWTTFDNRTVNNQGSASFSWSDNVVNYEECGTGLAAYPNKYPYYNGNLNWSSATSFTLLGRFKAQNATDTYACLFGMGWNNECVSVGAKSGAVTLAWVGNWLKTADNQAIAAGNMTKEDVTADLTGEYHDYALVYNHSANTLSLYLDGELVLTKSDVKITLGDGKSKQGGIFGMGGGEVAGGGPVRNGATRCDDYRIYGVALTTKQLAKLAGKGLTADGWSTKVDYNATAATTFTTGEGKTAWMTEKGGESTGIKHRVVNANGSDSVQVVYHDGSAEADKWHPYWSGFSKRGTFTIAAYVNLNEVTISDSKTYGVLWCVGNNSGSEVILAKDGSGNLIAGNFNAGTPVEGATATIDAALVTSGYHLITVEFSTEFGTSITLDDGTAEGSVAICAAAKNAVSNNGLQIGAILSGLTGQCGRADGAAISDIYYYDDLLAKGAVVDLVAELAEKYPTSDPDPEPEYDPDNDAAIGEDKYASIETALLSLNSESKTLRLLRDVSLDHTLAIDGLVKGTIDLNGYSIENSGEGDVVSIAYGATVTITGKGLIVKEGEDYAITSRGLTTISAANGTPVIGGIVAAPSRSSKVSFAYGYYPESPVKTKIDWTGCVSNADTPVLSAHHTSEHSYSSVYTLSLNPIQEIDGVLYEAEFGGGFVTDTEYVRFFNYLYTVAVVTMDVTENVTIPHVFNVATETESGIVYARIAKAVKSGTMNGKPLFSYTPMPADINFQVLPNSGYRNPTVKANGVAVEPNENGYYHITAVDGGVAIVVTAEEIPTVPSWINSEDPAAVEKYNTWATAKGVTDPTTAKKAAFAFNCENTDAAIKEENDAFVITSIEIVDGVPQVTAKLVNLAGEEYNVTPVIKGSATVNGEYTLEKNNASAKFFKAVIDLE